MHRRWETGPRFSTKRGQHARALTVVVENKNKNEVLDKAPQRRYVTATLGFGGGQERGFPHETAGGGNQRWFRKRWFCTRTRRTYTHRGANTPLQDVEALMSYSGQSSYRPENKWQGQHCKQHPLQRKSTPLSPRWCKNQTQPAPSKTCEEQRGTDFSLPTEKINSKRGRRNAEITRDKLEGNEYFYRVHAYKKPEDIAESANIWEKLTGSGLG